MLQKGDLIWIPEKSVLLVETPNNPQAIRITQEPEVGLYIGISNLDVDFYIVHSKGRDWVTNKKHVKRLRSDYVS